MRLGVSNAGRGDGRDHSCIFCRLDRLCVFLRARSVKGREMESIVMLAASALMMVYLLYALLYPEKF
jgi:K+-transporting ATPase KdpF subunit